MADTPLSVAIRDAFILASFQVIMALEREEIIRFLTENPKIQLLLIDSDLPGVNGYETINYLRANGFSHLIIILMAWFNLQSLTAANLVGCNEFIAKPVNVANLLIAARQQLRSQIANE